MPLMHDLRRLKQLASNILAMDMASTDARTALESMVHFSRGFLLHGAFQDHRNTWWRARKCSNGSVPKNAPPVAFDNLSELLYIPTGNPRLGRCNLPGQKVLYAGSNMRTAWLEIGAQPGDVVQLVSFRQRFFGSMVTPVIGAYREFQDTGKVAMAPAAQEILRKERKTRQNHYKHCLFIDRFLSGLFAFKTDEKYMLTAALSDYYLKYRPGTAIVYPSVRNSSGRNIAMEGRTFDEQFEIIESIVIKIQPRTNDNVGFDYDLIRRSDQFGPNGEILWDLPAVASDFESFG
ncbi:RES domain-containing protein [Massilia jejuensis]|uniref:RES domain-containing protein n=1 Tax=Massilia jejuensis TaxID=648894 RepID=A0ABW0PRI2_9BURK